MVRYNIASIVLGLVIVLIFVISFVSFVKCVDANGWDRLWVCTERVVTVRESPRNSR